MLIIRTYLRANYYSFSFFYLIIFCCSIKGYALSIDSDTIKTEQVGIYDRAEIMPKLNIGEIGLMEYVREHIIYPKDVLEQKLGGIIIVKFIIDIDGSVQNPVILKDGVGGSGTAAKEALRLVNSMPKWKPGTQRGIPVRVYYTIPINFKV